MHIKNIIGVMMLAGALTACTAEKTSQEMEWEVQTSKGWIPAKVPSTIMGVLTANGIEPEALMAEDYAKID